MADPFIGEIRAFAFQFTPQGWLTCDGSAHNTFQYQALAAILQNRFGGNSSQFNVPDLRGRATTSSGGTTPWQAGSASPQFAATWGISDVALVSNQVPPHTHQAFGVGAITPSSTASSTATATSYLSVLRSGPTIFYDAWSTNTPTQNEVFSSQMINALGGGQNGFAVPHTNVSPFLTFRFCICHDGIFPTQN